MTFQTQMIADGQYITHAEMPEEITYTATGSAAATIKCIPNEEDALFEENLKDGDGTIEDFTIWITDNSDSTNYPGIAVPARGDAVTFRSKSCRVVGVTSIALNGLWPLVIRVVGLERRTPSDITIDRR